MNKLQKELLKDTLELSRIEAVRIGLELSEFHLQAMLETVPTLVREHATARCGGDEH